jgi:hypothetical protein
MPNETSLFLHCLPYKTHTVCDEKSADGFNLNKERDSLSYVVQIPLALIV